MNAAADRIKPPIDNNRNIATTTPHGENHSSSDDPDVAARQVKISESREKFVFAPVDWDELVVIPYEQLAQRRSTNNCRHAAHGMLYTRIDSKWQGYKQRGWILMQMRFDGSIGFPGGMVDDHNETVHQLEAALDREFREEAGLEDAHFTRSEHVVTHYVPSWNIMLSFYCKEIAFDKFLDCERKTLRAEEYGQETLGIVRPPLYNLMSNRGRTGGGFATFIRNQFPGNGLLQLLMGLVHSKLFTKNELLSEIRWSLAPPRNDSNSSSSNAAESSISASLHRLCDYFERQKTI